MPIVIKKTKIYITNSFFQVWIQYYQIHRKWRVKQQKIVRFCVLCLIYMVILHSNKSTFFLLLLFIFYLGKTRQHLLVIFYNPFIALWEKVFLTFILSQVIKSNAIKVLWLDRLAAKTYYGKCQHQLYNILLLNEP